MTRFPLQVQFEYHPASTDAASLAESLHCCLNDDPAVPGLRIPTCFTPDDGTRIPPESRIAAEADRVLVVLLADDHLAAHARRPAVGASWADYVVALRKLCESSRTHRFMPIQVTEHAWPIDPRLNDLNFLRAWTIDKTADRRRFIARRLVHLLIRRLRPHEPDEDAPALTIFLSHTKVDLDQEPRVVKALLAHLTATQPEKTWFDSGDIASGSSFAREIERGVTDSALLAVVTDSYSSRSWCRREVLFAKQHQRPVVVIDAIQEREIRSFPYVGNVPVIRWKGDPQEIVDLLLRESLRHAYAEEFLKQRMRPDDDVLPAGPELVTLVHRDKNQSVLYPDPPLGQEELAVLDATGIRVETPLQRHARERQWSGSRLTVALSVSQAEDIARFGLRSYHLDTILLELSRYLLLSGFRLAYGGHLGPEGYTVRLADLLNDPILEQLRGKKTPEQAPPSQLLNYIAWPTAASVHDEARLGPLVEVRRCVRPEDVDEALDPVFVPSPLEDVPVDSAARRFAWARGLTEMRRLQTIECAARVVVGGRLGTPAEAYKGRMPGILEEVLLATQVKQPVYLVGAFGGCARMAIDALQGVPRTEMTWATQSHVPFSEELRDLYRERGQQWDEYDEIAAGLRARGLAGLSNGLSGDENLELASTRSVERSIELILAGLQKMHSTAANAGAK